MSYHMPSNPVSVPQCVAEPIPSRYLTGRRLVESGTSCVVIGLRSTHFSLLPACLCHDSTLESQSTPPSFAQTGLPSTTKTPAAPSNPSHAGPNLILSLTHPPIVLWSIPPSAPPLSHCQHELRRSCREGTQAVAGRGEPTIDPLFLSSRLIDCLRRMSITPSDYTCV